MLNEIAPFAIALLIGLFIGIERERSHPAGSQAMGVRTFIIIALMGALSAAVNQPYLALTSSLFVFGIIILSYHRSSKSREVQGFGITTEVAGAIVYFLGFFTKQAPLFSALIAIAVLLTLFLRTKLHIFSRDWIQTKEIVAVITILIIGLGIVPFLPNYPVDPWQVFNPRRYVMLILVLSIIEFAGYLAIRIFGDKLGLLLSCFFSGLVSSTATFLMLMKLAKNQKANTSLIIASGLLATNAMLIETILLLSLISHSLINSLLPAILVMLAIGFLSTWPVLKNKNARTNVMLPENPFELKGVIKLATFILGMLILITIIRNNVGVDAVHLISFLGGLFEVHSVNIANASLFVQHKFALPEARLSIGLALGASYITKIFLLWSMADKKLAFQNTLYLLLMFAAGTVAFVLF